MRNNIFACLCLFLSSCAFLKPAGSPTPTANQNLISTITSSGPMIEVSFDGLECTIDGPAQIPTGSFAIKFTNKTDHIVTPWVDRRYPGKSWQDVLDFIGPPGSSPPDLPAWISVLFYKYSTSENSTTIYRQYDLTMEAEYDIIVEMDTDQVWACGQFKVKNSP